MKIDVDSKTGLLSTLPETAQTRSQKETSVAMFVSDSVELSNKERAVAGITERVKDSPSIRQDKVDIIKSAVESGKYVVNVTQVVRAILKNNLLDELLCNV